jgi:hypothetical protein
MAPIETADLFLGPDDTTGQFAANRVDLSFNTGAIEHGHEPDRVIHPSLPLGRSDDWFQRHTRPESRITGRVLRMLRRMELLR